MIIKVSPLFIREKLERNAVGANTVRPFLKHVVSFDVIRPSFQEALPYRRMMPEKHGLNQ